MYEFRMPSLGADMEAGTLSKWLVQPGDTVKRGDVIAIIETEKSDIEVEIFASGVVDKLLIQKGQRVPVGTLLATLMTNGEVRGPSPISSPGEEGERALITPTLFSQPPPRPPGWAALLPSSPREEGGSRGRCPRIPYGW
ncbi:MAG: biotin/lipoyl-containing protein [Thermoanaerobaculia bacterium]